MKKPIVALVGRPNVGKSTFFNKVSGKRISIVKDTPGVTRDRVYADAEWCSHYFTMIDTGGIDQDDNSDLMQSVRRQAEIAIELSDVVLFFTDAKDGILPADYEIARILRKTTKPVVLAVNKTDAVDKSVIYDFYALGFDEPYAISSEHGLGIGDLLDEVVKNFKDNQSEQESEALKIALVGKPNVGKSSLVNKLLGSERVIVSDIAGTTREAIDTPFTYNQKDYILIDTAGLRRKRTIERDSIESYSVMRTISAIRRADVVFILIDASEQITEQDIKIAGLAHEEGKPSIIVMNKWDKADKDAFTIDKVNKQLDIDLDFMSYYKSVFVSALTGQRLNKLLEMAQDAHANADKRISTGTLNELIFQAIAASEPPAFSGRRLKIYYTTQVQSCPPTFVIFINDEKLVHFSYKRYLENFIRKSVDFSYTPIKLKFVQKEQKE